MPRTKILFTDWRAVECGGIAWTTSDDRRFGVANPPGTQVPMRAVPRGVSHGIWLAAKPARKVGSVEGDYVPSRVIFEDGRYRAWYLEVDGHSELGTGAAAHRANPSAVIVCGIESDDGLHWSTPTRSKIEVPGQRNFDGLTSFIDPHAPDGKRYKLAYCANFADGMH